MKDILGVFAALACFLHCIGGSAFAAIGIYLVGQSWNPSEFLHYALTGIMLLLAILAFPAGYRRHRQFAPLLLASLGIASMLAAIRVGERFELWWMLLSAFSMIMAHLLNGRLLKGA